MGRKTRREKLEQRGGVWDGRCLTRPVQSFKFQFREFFVLKYELLNV